MRSIRSIFIKYGISITFTILIFGFAFASLLLPDQAISANENRPLQQKPVFSLQACKQGRFQKESEAYASDQFPLRSSWVMMHADLQHQLGQKEINSVLIGKQDTLFQKSVVPSKKKIKQLQNTLNTFVAQHKDIHTSMLLVPNKATILEGKLPSNRLHQNQSNTMHTFAKGLSSQIQYVDTLTPLQKHHNEYIYYRSDHHWTTKGAYLAFQAWKQRVLSKEPSYPYTFYPVSTSFYGTLANTSGFYRGKPDTVDIATTRKEPAYTVKFANQKKATTTLYDASKAKSYNPYDVFLSGNQPLIDIETTVENTSHLLLLKDSYANCFIPFLLPYYSKITIVDPRYYYDDLNQLIKDRSITDALFLYNANTFFSDTSLQNVIMEAK